MRAVAAVLVLNVTLGALTSPVHAQPRSGQQDVKAQARKRFNEGKRLQAAGSYPAAIAEYQAAYDLAPHPDLIFNIAQCQRLKGDAREALASYERYVREAPDGRGVPEARSHIATLSAALARLQPAPAPVPEPQAPKPEPPPPAVPAVTEQPEPAAAPSAHPGRGLRIGGLVTGGAGVLLLGGGVLFALRASSKADDVNALGQKWDEDLYQSGVSARRNSAILFAAGAAAVVTGGVLYFLGVKAANRERLSVIPGSRSVALRVRF